MEGHAENARVGRGEGVDWIVKESFETEAEMKAYCTENCLARGLTNHNIGKRVTYLTCVHDDCDVKMRLIKKLDQELYVLEADDNYWGTNLTTFGVNKAVFRSNKISQIPDQINLNLDPKSTKNGANISS